MNILMVTNTFTPHVGGVARSVERFTSEYRRQGRRVVVVAPEFEGQPDRELDVVRVPAIRHFSDGDFSMSLPVIHLDSLFQDGFRPDLIHSHHPYLLGDTALRLGAKFGVPVVFTHHTMYEEYTHYVPGDWEQLRKFVVELATGYANMCAHVIAPSGSVGEIIRSRGVSAPIEVIPTGVETDDFREGEKVEFRRKHDIPAEAFVAGHLGRLAPEKNPEFLCRSLVRFLSRHKDAHFLVVGDGPSAQDMRRIFSKARQEKRVHFTGTLKGRDVVDAYHAMDVFAFSSKSETQGLVLVEAMASGVPVVALDAPGARDVCRDTRNGRLVKNEDPEEFAQALTWTKDRLDDSPEWFSEACGETAGEHSAASCADRVLALYKKILDEKPTRKGFDEKAWDTLHRRVRREWELWNNRLGALADTISDAVGKGD